MKYKYGWKYFWEKTLSFSYKNIITKNTASQYNFTPFELVKEIIEKIPNFNGDILVFNLEFAVYLIEEKNISPDKIIAWIDNNTKWAMYKEFSVYKFIHHNEFINEKHIYTHNLKTGEKYIDMKFNVVVGNPPFQDAIAPGKKLWPKFYNLMLDTLVEDGFGCLITPSTFLNRPVENLKKLVDKISDLNCIEINADINKYFNIGEDVVYILINNKKQTNKETLVIFETGVEKQKYNIISDIYFGNDSRLIKSITKKLIDYKDKIKFRQDLHDNQPTLLRAGVLSTVKSDEYPYEIYYSPVQKHYSKNLIKDGNKLKLMITIGGAWYLNHLPNKNIFISNSMSGQNMNHILISSEEEGIKIKNVLISKLYRFYVEKNKTSGFNSMTTKLPLIDFSRNWSNQEIYEYFNLTQEEIDYIEKTVK